MKIKKCKFAKYVITQKYLKLIELFLSVFCVKLDVKNEIKKCV